MSNYDEFAMNLSDSEFGDVEDESEDELVEDENDLEDSDEGI